jgi:hypothetical protein
MGRDLLRPEGASILLPIKQPDLTNPNTVVIEIELLGGIDRVADLDPLTDIGGGDFIERTFEANGSIVIDDPFVADKKDFIELFSGEPSDQDPTHGGVITVDRSLLNPGVKFMVIIVLKPERKGFVQFLQGKTLLETREEPFTNTAEESLDFPTRGTVIGFGMDQGDPGLGTASRQEVGGEGRRVITIKTLANAVGQEGFLENDGQGADRLGATEGMTDYHTGVVIEDGTENGLGRAVPDANLRTMHEIRDPEIVDVIHFVGLSHIDPILKREPSLLFDHPEQGIVVNGRLPQEILIPKHFIKFLPR